MNVYETILKRRSIRKYKQLEVNADILNKLINAARVAPQGANLQPLKYIVVNNKELLSSIFDTIGWAAYIKPEGNPKEDERPTAYIVVLADTEIKKVGYDIDAGAAVENILLTAEEESLGTCWLGAINRDKIKAILNIPERYVVHTMVALGYPTEEPVMEESKDDSIKYYKDANGVLHVPKRKFEEVVFYNKF